MYSSGKYDDKTVLNINSVNPDLKDYAKHKDTNAKLVHIFLSERAGTNMSHLVNTSHNAVLETSFFHCNDPEILAFFYLDQQESWQ